MYALTPARIISISYYMAFDTLVKKRLIMTIGVICIDHFEVIGLHVDRDKRHEIVFHLAQDSLLILYLIA